MLILDFGLVIWLRRARLRLGSDFKLLIRNPKSAIRNNLYVISNYMKY
jgi:hypothetical protein